MPVAFHMASTSASAAEVTELPENATELAVALNASLLTCFLRKRPANHPKPTAAAMRAAHCALRHTRSQHVEDMLLLPTLLQAAGWGRRGVFVELGAYDGYKYSNTFVLERCFGWRGVLIEANPANFARLQKSPYRSATKVHSAVCNRTGWVNFTTSGGVEAGDSGTGHVFGASFFATWSDRIPLTEIESSSDHKSEIKMSEGG